MSSLRTTEADQTYRLRWNNDSSAELNLSEAFRDFRDTSEFLDVTLGCTVSNGGSKSLRAHKIILSAYSPAFKEMFQQHSNRSDPFIFLKGVSYPELNNLLDFMYNGEVKITKSNLSNFLALAEELQIKGLAKGDGNTINKRPKPATPFSSLKEKTTRYETLSKYLKQENPYDLNDDFGQSLISNGIKTATKHERAEEKAVSKYVSKPRTDALQEDDDGEDDNDEPIPPGEVGEVEDFIKNLNKHLISGNQKRTVAKCRICLRQLRRDKIKQHIRGSHASYLVHIPKEEPEVTSSNAIMEDDFSDFRTDLNQEIEESYLDSQL